MDAVKQRRVWGYPLTAVIVAALVWGGFVYEAEPDVGVLLSTVDVQLRMAYAIPAEDKQGNRLTGRDEMLAEAEKMLDTIDRLEPDFAPTLEYRAFLRRLQGRYDEACAHYQELRDHPDCSPALWTATFFNEARSLDDAGRTERALEVVRASRAQYSTEMQEECELYSAALLHKLGRTPEAIQTAFDLAHAQTVGPMTAVRAGRLLEDFGEAAAAEAAYVAAGEGHGSGLYHRSRLKMLAGADDTALGLLERAVEASPVEVRRFLNQELDTWKAVAETTRFQQIRSVPEATPVGPAR